MEVVKTLHPGDRGTRRYLEKYGARLVCVRYRQDKRQKRRLTTIEIVVNERPLINIPGTTEKLLYPHPNRHVFIHVAYREESLRRRVKQAGGKWLPNQKLWQLPFHKAAALGLQSRVRER